MGEPEAWRGPREEAILDLFDENRLSKLATDQYNPYRCWGHDTMHADCTLSAGVECGKARQCNRAPATVVGLCHQCFEAIIGGVERDHQTAATSA